MTTTNQFLSIELSRHLSSLVPGFEGHYYYTKYEEGDGVPRIICYPQIFCEDNHYKSSYEIICPAWQVEDVLRNLRKIAQTFGEVQYCPRWREVGTIIANHLIDSPDTAYQKIEEYLWTILK